jgi:hypothetical protein
MRGGDGEVRDESSECSNLMRTKAAKRRLFRKE